MPGKRETGVTLLCLHGGGYAFHAVVTQRFAETLAHHLAARLFALDYRLTPEHPHSAQQKDALAAYRYLLAPIYLQGGGREILIDMIRDFARVVAAQEAAMLDVWPDMTHEFHVHGLTHSESALAFQRIRAAMDKYTHAHGNALALGQCEVTEICNRIDV